MVYAPLAWLSSNAAVLFTFTDLVLGDISWPPFSISKKMPRAHGGEEPVQRKSPDPQASPTHPWAVALFSNILFSRKNGSPSERPYSSICRLVPRRWCARWQVISPLRACTCHPFRHMSLLHVFAMAAIRVNRSIVVLHSTPLYTKAGRVDDVRCSFRITGETQVYPISYEPMSVLCRSFSMGWSAKKCSLRKMGLLV
ncbi:hypothetical protein F5148DRAFT_520464 [Russula earlei]|uniref:Uncharacterized protein n=1 Tax=Russula earlei TaxID=71964 RepID=A0ACC0TX49_9AGAM|nr:hypothetical protein F5148DRAFT_520464 [Russula earlei]